MKKNQDYMKEKDRCIRCVLEKKEKGNKLCKKCQKSFYCDGTK